MNDYTKEFILEKFEPFFSANYGIINHYYLIPFMEHMPKLFYGTCRLTNLSLFTGYNMNFSIGGCGETSNEALIATFGEALERYSASIVPINNIIYTTYASLIKDKRNVINPQKFNYFLEKQYAEPNFDLIPFTNNTFLGWIEGISLFDDEKIYIPACYAYIPYLHHKEEKFINHNTSTGLAFGFTKEEAILSGLCEVIERDCFSIVWYGKLSIPKIDFQNTGSSIINKILDQYFNGFLDKITILDMTNDLKIPAFLGFMEMDDQYTELPAVCFGAAANPDKEKALYKTLLEVAQTYVFAWHLKCKNENNDIIFNGNYSNEIINFDRSVLFYSYKKNRHNIEFLKHSKKIKRFSEITDFKQQDIKSLIDIILKQLSLHNFKPIIVDITSLDIKNKGGFVYRTVIPELVPLNGSYKYRYLGNPRIYNVPATMGYYANPLTETQINTAPHPFP